MNSDLLDSSGSATASVQYFPSRLRPRAPVGPPLEPAIHPRLCAIGTANPPDRYRQEEVLHLLNPQDKRIRSLFLSSHIQTRHLCLPPAIGGERHAEGPDALIAKHKREGLKLGRTAIEKCLASVGLSPADIDFLCVITSTGYLCPGFSAFLIRDMGFRPDVHRMDILGMGCNAGMNGLNPTCAFAARHPGKRALMVCIEVCSAAYVNDGSLTTAVVNSLFGDGAVALLVEAGPALHTGGISGPRVLDFQSQIVVEGIHTMRFDHRDGMLAFFLDRDIPYYIGAHVAKPIGRLLQSAGLRLRHIKHWVVHSGGRKVIDSVKYNLDLSDHDVRHTLSVLRDFGNLSSGSFLFSLERLHAETIPTPGDFGVLMAMGPGASIETALVRW